MTYNTSSTVYSPEEQENRQSADYMATFIMVMAVIWLLGAALMFVAAWKGTTITHTAPAEAAASQPADAAATPAAPATAP